MPDFTKLNQEAAMLEKMEASEREKQSSVFKMRIAAQQFLKNNSSLLKSYLKKGGTSAQIDKPGIFAEKTVLARQLAIEIAAHVLKKPSAEVSLEEARHFRTEAADAIANSWDGNVPLDPIRLAEEIAAAIGGADEVYDAELIKWAQMSGAGNATMTAAVAAISLAGAVDLYAFRHDNATVLGTLCATLMQATMESVKVMLPDSHTAEDQRSLSQTTMRSYSILLQQIYETAAREALFHMDGLTEAQKIAWLKKEKPLEKVITNFKVWTRDTSRVAASLAKSAITTPNQPPNKPQ